MRYTSPVNGRARAIPVRYFVAGDGLTSSPDGSLRDGPPNIRGYTLYSGGIAQALPPDSIGRFESLSYPANVGALQGSTSIHEQARVIDLSYMGLFNGLQWLASSTDGYRKESSRICCAADVARPGIYSFGYTGFLGGGVGAIAYGIDLAKSTDIGDGVYVDERSSRLGIAMCGKLNALNLETPFVMFSHGPVTQANEAQRTHDPYQPTTIINHRISYSYAFFESCIEVVGGQQQGPQRLLLAFGPTVQKCAICFRHGDAKFFATLLSGRLSGLVPAWPYDSGGGVHDPSPTVFRAPSPVGVGDWRGNRVRASFFRFECNSLQIPQSLASRNDVAGIPNAGPRLLCAGVENSELSAMVGDSSPFDFGSTTTIPFVSNTIQARTNDLSSVQFLSGDAAFENPQYQFVNSPAVLGVGHMLSRLPDRERTPNAETATYRKHGPQSSGTLVDEEMVLVSLRSARMLCAEPPLSDDDICFPVMQPADQSVFRFRGKTITGAKLSFEPWSSNTFTTPIRSFGATQLEQPDPGGVGQTQVNNDTIVISGIFSTPQTKPQALSGTYVGNFGKPTSAVTYEEVATPDDYWDRLYSTIQHDQPSNPGQHPELAAIYSPNASYDELAFMAGALAESCPTRTGSGGYIGYYSVGKIESGSVPYYGVRPQDIDDHHPAAWKLSYDGSQGGGLQSVSSSRIAMRSLLQIQQANSNEGTLNFMPSLAGKAYDCTSKTLFGFPLQAGLFHCLSSGVEQNKTATINFCGIKTTSSKTASTEQIGQTKYLHVVTTTQTAAWDGSVDHECTFKTPVVEIFVRWSASLQSPGQYKVREPLPEYADYDGLSTAGSIVAPQMFCRKADRDSVTPILVADVWVRAVGECDVSSTYDFPSEFGTSGTYSHKTYTQGSNGNIYGQLLASDLVDLSDTSFGHAKRWFDAATENTVWPKNQEIPTDQKATRYLGAFPFNRAQTQRLLDGEEVEPTYWFLDDEGTALESQPVTVPWHNETFGTYKLKFRLITA